MEGVLWWGLVLALVLVILVLFAPWRASGGEADRDDPERGSTDIGGGPPFVRSADGVTAVEEPRPPPVPGRCRACGTDNDPFYTFCRECLTPLH
ncbi:DUF7577 domain-containing protein [Halosolutus gelatinilyticus]|uniref:DUF7577 domain-containing protein n=1 Tax=Halosolutus gelatinilyticus TaxID=2931975 RepID=UPI001FF63D02|nr:hypothetical protein [Halosolutus gelatinilyticus]